MLSPRLLSVGLFALLPLAAQVNVVIAPRQHAPIKIVEEHLDGTVTSNNWSGYAVTGNVGTFTQAAGSWIVPAVSCTSGTQYAAFWVGIDGYKSKTVEQTGTDSDCSKGTPNYYAWYEFFPQPSFVITSMSVQPGDVMSASVTYSGSKFTLKISNGRTGKSFSKTERVPGATRKSAEWIAEAPTSTGGIEPLADFGTILFGEDSTAVSGTCEATTSVYGQPAPISSFSNIAQITMVSTTGATESVPSALSTDGTSFSATWVSK